VFFTRNDSDFDPSSEERLKGRTLCVPANRDLAPPTEKVARMMQDGRLKLARPPSMIDCLNIVGRGDADALLVNELEGKRAIADLGLSQAFRVVENAGSAQEVRIIIAKDSPNAEELLSALNRGIAKLKSEEVYSQIIMRHLVSLNRSATAR
jgi:polar amino acid transport system substrate-binding protein